MDENNAMIQLSGLWLNESKNGNKYMIGYLGENRLMVFKNQFKERENQPDYIIYIVPPKKISSSDDQSVPF